MKTIKPLKEHLGLAILLIFATTTASQAESRKVKVQMTGKNNVTAVSGYAGQYKAIKSGNDYQALKQLTWFQTKGTRNVLKHEPRQIEIETRHLNKGWNTRKTLVAKIGQGGRTDPKTVKALGWNDYFYKIQVCTNDSTGSLTRYRIKGIRAWSRTLNDKNPLTITDQPSAYERKHPNCKKWHTPVSCGAGEIARGIRAHYERDWFSGIALICKKVQLKSAKSKAPTGPLGAPSKGK